MRRFRSALLLLCVTPLSVFALVACASTDGASEESATSNDEALRALTASEIIGNLSYGGGWGRRFVIGHRAGRGGGTAGVGVALGQSAFSGQAKSGLPGGRPGSAALGRR